MKPGERYGTWTVESEADKPQYYTCRCDCGVVKAIRKYDLLSGKSKTCKSCASELAKKTHGGPEGQYSSEYASYRAMLARCSDPRNKSYPRYGGRGITVCDLWKDSFEVFLLMMGTKPDPTMTIDRIDSNGNYEPGNCKWSTCHEQNSNKGDNVKLEFDGETKTVREWSRDPRCVVTDKILYKRIARGWDPVRAITTPKL